MSNEKFTQTEWCVDSVGVHHTIKNTDTLTTVCDYVFGKSNAHLISAATNMYRALKKMVDMHIEDFGCSGLDNEVIDQACAALAKADGEE